LEVLAKIPINPENARTVDAGSVEYLEASWLDTAVEKVTSLI
jgi:nucleotide-binding protein